MVDPSKLFPCDCMGEGLTITKWHDDTMEEEGEVLMSEMKDMRDCQEAPYIQISFWEFGHPKHGRWSWWWRVKIAYAVFKNKSPWPDMVMMTAAHAKNFANHMLYIIKKGEREIKQKPLVELPMKELPNSNPILLVSDLVQPEKPHAMFCVMHGGSPDCERVNKEHGFICPRCVAKPFGWEADNKSEGVIDDIE